MTIEATNYDEARVPSFILPDPLAPADGNPVTSPSLWQARRAELLELFARHQYGFAPAATVAVQGNVLCAHADALGGAATLKQVEIVLGHRGKSHSLGLLLFLPNAAPRPATAFLGLNFFGNHTVHPDPRIRLHASWSPNDPGLGISGNRATAASRGRRASRWPVEEIVARGCALATVYCGDIDPDFDDGFRDGVHGLFDDGDHAVAGEERWGTIAGWAWGLSRILDYIVAAESAVDPSRVIAIGHSRLGKAALWAAANDTRFAAAISNNSGCAGAALHRRLFGERLANLNATFPHWLDGRSRDYNEREDALPFDQHELLALIAPRPLYVASADADLWADPRGEFLSLLHAAPVYRLLGAGGMDAQAMPPPGGAIAGRLSYHLRRGPHDIRAEDWLHYLGFAAREVG